MKWLLSLASLLFFAIQVYAAISHGLSAVPEAQRKVLSSRLGQYVSAYRAKDWGRVYEFVSKQGKGDTDKQQFISAMNAEHGTEFAQMPDLLDFTPMKSAKVSDGYNVYGCGKAQREGMKFNGVAVVHTVFEQDSWTFSGWSFTEFPNEPCIELGRADWAPDTEMEFTEPMKEVQQFKASGAPIHVDSPK